MPRRPRAAACSCVGVGATPSTRAPRCTCCASGARTTSCSTSRTACRSGLRCGPGGRSWPWSTTCTVSSGRRCSARYERGSAGGWSRWAAPRVYARERYITVSDATRRELADPRRRPRAGDGRLQRQRPARPCGARGSPADRRTRRLVVLGRLVPHKRVELAIDCLARAPDQFPGLRLTVVGQGYWEPQLRPTRQRLGVTTRSTSSASWTRPRSTGCWPQAWLALLPSVKEGWGLAVVEAGVHGTPTVAFRPRAGLPSPCWPASPGSWSTTTPSSRRRSAAACRRAAATAAWVRRPSTTRGSSAGTATVEGRSRSLLEEAHADAIAGRGSAGGVVGDERRPDRRGAACCRVDRATAPSPARTAPATMATQQQQHETGIVLGRCRASALLIVGTLRRPPPVRISRG